jgi:hypothetical protein
LFNAGVGVGVGAGVRKQVFFIAGGVERNDFVGSVMQMRQEKSAYCV